MLFLPATVAAVLAGILLQSRSTLAWTGDQIPEQAQFISPRSFAVLDQVAPTTVQNGTSVSKKLATTVGGADHQYFFPPGTTRESLKAKPFLVYSEEFYNIIGSNPTLTLIAKTDSDPLFHEAVVWYPPTDEVFFVQNAGAEAAGTGLNKSAIIQKIALSQADAVTSQADASGQVDVVVVDSQPQVINPNGGSS
jgi:gluconolactonase